MAESSNDVTPLYQSIVNSMTDVKSESMDDYETPLITPDMFVQGLSVAGSELGVTVTPSNAPSITPSTVSKTPTIEKRTARKTGQGPKKPVTLVTGPSGHSTAPKRILGTEDEVDQEWSLMDSDSDGIDYCGTDNSGTGNRRRGRRKAADAANRKLDSVIRREVASIDLVEEDEILGGCMGSSDGDYDPENQEMDGNYYGNEGNPGGLEMKGTLLPLEGRNVTGFGEEYTGSDPSDEQGEESDDDRRRSRRSSRKRKPKYQDSGSDDDEDEYKQPKRASRSRSSSKKGNQKRGNQKRGNQKRGKREEKSSEKWIRPKRPAYVPLTAIVTAPTDAATTVTSSGRMRSTGKAASGGGKSSHEGSHRASMDTNGPSPATGRHSFLQRSNRVWNMMEKKERDDLLTKYIIPLTEGADAGSNGSKTTWKILPFNESCSMCHVSFDDPGRYVTHEACFTSKRKMRELFIKKPNLPFDCEVCADEYHTREDLERHVTIHFHPRFVCTVGDGDGNGDRSFSTVEDGEKSFSTVEDGDRSICTVEDGDRSFSTVEDGGAGGSKSIHASSAESGVGSNGSELIKTSIVGSMGISVCGQRSFTREDAEEHSKSHRGVLYKCIFPGCDRSFKEKSAGNDHLQRAHFDHDNNICPILSDHQSVLSDHQSILSDNQSVLPDHHPIISDGWIGGWVRASRIRNRHKPLTLSALKNRAIGPLGGIVYGRRKRKIEAEKGIVSKLPTAMASNRTADEDDDATDIEGGANEEGTTYEDTNDGNGANHENSNESSLLDCGKVETIQKYIQLKPSRETYDDLYEHTPQDLSCDRCGTICDTISLRIVHKPCYEIKRKERLEERLCREREENGGKLLIELGTDGADGREEKTPDSSGRQGTTDGADNHEEKTPDSSGTLVDLDNYSGAGFKKYDCEFCTRSYHHFHALIAHSVKHKENEFTCKECSFMTSTKFSMILHLQHHTGEKLFRCIFPGCSKSDGWREERFVRKHIRTHHLARDDRTCRLLTCAIKFKSAKERVEHEEMHHPQFVEKVKSGKVRPSNHNQTGWTEQVIRMDKEAREEVLGTRKLPPDGPPGSKKTIPLSLTAQSIKLPDFEGTPKEKYDQLQNWLRQFVQTKPKPPEYANIANFYKIIPFNEVCHLCHREFITKASFVVHKPCYYVKRSRQLLEAGVEEGARYQCDVCSLTFEKLDSLRAHMAFHVGKQYVCSVEGCVKESASLEIARDHAEAHIKWKQYQCIFDPEVCARDFVDHYRVRQHVLRDHLGIKPFKCDQCDSSYVSEKELNRHEKARHSENFRCPVIVSTYKDSERKKKQNPQDGASQCPSTFSDHNRRLHHIRKRHPEYDIDSFIEEWNREHGASLRIEGTMEFIDGEFKITEVPNYGPEEAEYRRLGKTHTAKDKGGGVNSSSSFGINPFIPDTLSNDTDAAESYAATYADNLMAVENPM